METTRETIREQTIHRKLCLKVHGLGIVKEGDWRGLLIMAAHYGDRNWEIVEKLPLGERIITKHSSLLHEYNLNQKGV
jgi:hypothetical protein